MARTRKAIVAVLIVYGLLVATHEGEFWPFSVYPMFSQAGHSWSRIVVYEAPLRAPSWEPRAVDELPDAAFALQSIGLKANDLASLIRTLPETASTTMLHQLLAPHADAPLLVMKAEGRLSDDAEGVDARLIPLALIRPDTLLLNPDLYSVPPMTYPWGKDH